MRDPHFDSLLTDDEGHAWSSFKMVISNFLGNTKSAYFRDLVTTLLATYNIMGCRMSLKMHFLHSNLDFFPDNLGAMSDEHGERFHQDIASMEQRYQGRWDAAMMGDFCWFLRRETSGQPKRKALSKLYFS